MVFTSYLNIFVYLFVGYIRFWQKTSHSQLTIQMHYQLSSLFNAKNIRTIKSLNSFNKKIKNKSTKVYLPLKANQKKKWKS